MTLVGKQVPETTTTEHKIAAYQPTSKENYHSNNESEELRHLREENRLLKTAQRGPQQYQPSHSENYRSNDMYREIRDEIRKMQSRIDGFVRTNANTYHRQELPRVRTVKFALYVTYVESLVIAVIEAATIREQPVSQFGHHKQPRLYFSPTVQSKETQTSQPQVDNASKHPIAPNTAQVSVTSQTNQPFHQQSRPEAQAENVYYVRRSQPIPSTSMNNEVPTINTFDAATPKHSLKETTVNDEPKSDVQPYTKTTSTQSVEATLTPAERIAEVQEKQEIVIRLEI